MLDLQLLFDGSTLNLTFNLLATKTRKKQRKKICFFDLLWLPFDLTKPNIKIESQRYLLKASICISVSF